MKTLAADSKTRFAGVFRFAFPALAVASLLAFTAHADAAVIREGPVYTPPGATNFRISAAQGIDASTRLGKTGFSPQVNRNFEFTPSIGVTYQKDTGSLTDFGLGLYETSAHLTQSTGLNIQYTQPMFANSVTFRVMDFDIDLNATFFNPNKVEPGILILGANDSILASLTPENIFPNLVSVGNDVWDINLGALLSTINMPANTAINGFLLYADSTHGERANSDPYLLLSVGNGIPVIPEPATYLGGLGLVGLLLGAHAKAVLKKNRS